MQSRLNSNKIIIIYVVAPIAGSRMTETVMPAELLEALSPDFIAPFVAFLCSSRSSENGSCFELGVDSLQKCV